MDGVVFVCKIDEFPVETTTYIPYFNSTYTFLDTIVCVDEPFNIRFTSGLNTYVDSFVMLYNYNWLGLCGLY